MTRESANYQAILKNDNQPISKLKAHLHCTQHDDGDVGKTVSAMLATLASDGSASTVMTEWYRERLDDLQACDRSSRSRRLAYLAAEGAFLLRNLVGLDIDDAKWDSIFDDIRNAIKSTDQEDNPDRMDS